MIEFEVEFEVEVEVAVEVDGRVCNSTLPLHSLKVLLLTSVFTYKYTYVQAK